QAILLLRGIPEKNASCHRGGWIKSAANSFEIRGKKLGIVGYGSIGTQLSVLAEALGMQVFFYDVVTKLPLGNATQVGNLHDLLHIHENVPGVMSEINKVFADNGINISGQFLQTNEKVGYVVIDVDAEYSDLALEKLQHVTGTIRSRVLF